MPPLHWKTTAGPMVRAGFKLAPVYCPPAAATHTAGGAPMAPQTPQRRPAVQPTRREGALCVLWQGAPWHRRKQAHALAWRIPPSAHLRRRRRAATPPRQRPPTHRTEQKRTSAPLRAPEMAAAYGDRPMASGAVFPCPGLATAAAYTCTTPPHARGRERPPHNLLGDPNCGRLYSRHARKSLPDCGCCWRSRRDREGQDRALPPATAKEIRWPHSSHAWRRSPRCPLPTRNAPLLLPRAGCVSPAATSGTPQSHRHDEQEGHHGLPAKHAPINAPS